MGPKQHADSLRPQEYGGIEYAGLPASCAVINLCTNIFRSSSAYR